MVQVQQVVALVIQVMQVLLEQPDLQVPMVQAHLMVVQDL